jgi:hypothetical protein
MKTMSWILAILMLAPLPSLADTMADLSTVVSTRALKPYNEMPGTMRVGVIGGWAAALGDLSENVTSEGEKVSPSGLMGGLVVGFGDSLFSFETGALYVTLPGVTQVSEITDEATEETNESRVLINSQYVGVPLWLKYNYIEKPLASFYLKAGAIPLLLVAQDREQLELTDGSIFDLSLSKAQVLATVGIGGTSPINDHLAFVLDIMGFYGVIQEEGRTPYQGVIGSVGLSYDL